MTQSLRSGPGQGTNKRRFRTAKGYRLGWDGSVFQLFNNERRNTFIWLSKPQNRAQGQLGAVSINLDRFGNEVKTNVGRINKTALRSVEIYVISNRDRVGHQLLDLSYSNVPTTNIVPRIVNTPKDYALGGIANIDLVRKGS